MLTFLETAALIATVDQMPPSTVPLLTRRIRIFDTKNLIPVHREDTGRREGRLSIEGACMARIFSILHDAGLDADTLRPLHTKLSFQKRWAGQDDPLQSELAKVIAEIAAGEDVILTMELVRKIDPYRKFYHFRLDGHLPPVDASDRDNSRAKAALAMIAPSEIVELSTTINLTELLAPFIAAFEAA